jgi:hypothetical protein
MKGANPAVCHTRLSRCGRRDREPLTGRLAAGTDGEGARGCILKVKWIAESKKKTDQTGRERRERQRSAGVGITDGRIDGVSQFIKLA